MHAALTAIPAANQARERVAIPQGASCGYASAGTYYYISYAVTKEVVRTGPFGSKRTEIVRADLYRTAAMYTWGQLCELLDMSDSLTR